MGVALTAEELDYEQESTPHGELDGATVEACRRGEPLALRRFVVRYQHNVFAFLSRMMGAGPQVEDMAQEVFLRAYRALPRYQPRPGARLSTWLLKIAVHLVIDARKRKQLRTVPLDEQLEIEDHRTPDSEQRRREIARAFERAAAQLSDEHRMVFILSHFHGLTHAQIAELLEVPENTVKTRLFRAKARLRALLEQAWEDYR